MDDLSPFAWHEQRRDIERALFEPPAFRDEPGGRPLVYGYIRSANTRPSYVAACQRVQERYCRRERLALCTSFTDRNMPDTELVRPALTGLCDVLRLPDSFAVVTLEGSHLSAKPEVAEVLLRRIRSTGARLFLVRQEQPTSATVTGIQLQLPQWWE